MEALTTNLLLGSSSVILAVRSAVEQVAPTEATVLLIGETGTGKEIVARLIHSRSRRANGPFIAANCGAVTPGLAASDLFGHEVGAFTGAVRRRTGRFEAANKGTLLLDEIGELPIELQPLLLRVLEQREVERVGGDSFPVDVRIVAATNRALTDAVRTGRFREDLFYRLNIFPITVPPLRNRRDDISELAQYFLRHFAEIHRRDIDCIPGRILQLLTRHDWPGNIRELRNVIERAVIVSRGEKLAFDPAWLASVAEIPGQKETGRTWAAQEKARILEALRATDGRIYGPGGAAHRLGLRPTTLYGKIRKHGITKNPTDWM
jgi:transcriptional regulator with GAF, ATPase, and Fis domain